MFSSVLGYFWEALGVDLRVMGGITSRVTGSFCIVSISHSCVVLDSDDEWQIPQSPQYLTNLSSLGLDLGTGLRYTSNRPVLK
jgi:hypothetical protein